MFDPFSSGQATEAGEKPAVASFDPFASGKATATAPAEPSSVPEKNSSPQIGTNWINLFGGIEGMDERLTPEQRQSFKALDAVSGNAKQARAQAINQAYLQTQLTDIPHSQMERNWPAIRTAYAKQEFGMVDNDVSDEKLYGAISKRIGEQVKAQTEEVPPWTWTPKNVGDYAGQSLKGFWESLRGPFVDIPDAPHDLPDIPVYGGLSPALAGGVFNGIKSLIEFSESPLGLATLGVGTELKAASEAYPLAKAALVTMNGVFTGLMGYGTVKAIIKAPAILKDPNASYQDKVTALTEPVADAAATLTGVLGMALEMFPKAKGAEIVAELNGKNFAEASEIMKREAQTTDVPQHSGLLMDAAHELDRIASVKDKAALKETPETETKAPSSPEPVKEASGEPIGIKNAAIDEELTKMGLPEATHDEKVTFKGLMDDATAKLKDDPEAGSKLVSELTEKTRPVTAAEDALLVQEQVRLANARDRAEADLLKAQKEQNPEAIARAEQDVARTRDAFQQAADVVTKVGTKNAQALAARRILANRDYSLAAMERRQTVAAGRPLTPEEVGQVRDLNKQLTDAKARIDALEKAQREAKENPVREAPRRPKPPSKVSEFLTKQADQARARLKAKMVSGRVSSGIDPTDLADHAIIGADYIAKGVTKFADWSTAMVNELGEQIRPYLQDIFKQSIEARDQASKLQAYKTRTATAIEKGKEKLASGDFEKAQRKSMQMDPEAVKLKGEYERIKRKIQLKEQELADTKRTPLQKAKDLALAVNRAGVLSRVATIVKLTAIIAERAAITPIRQGIGLAVDKVLPGVAKQARFEDVPTMGGYVRSEAKAITAMLTKGLPGAWDILKMKDTDLQALLEKEHLPPGALSYPSHIHAALHYPVQVGDYARRLQLINERDIRADIDMSEPVNQLRNMQEAWEYSKRSVFLQDNKLVSVYQGIIKTLQSKGKNGLTSPIGKGAAFLLQAENPVLKVPANFATEVTEHIFGLADPPVRLAVKGLGGFKDLSYQEADMILRHVKNGSLGAALVLLGFFKYKQVGGFYEEGEKRKKNDAQAGEVKIGSATIPKIMLEDTGIQAMQAGATMHRTLDSVYRLNDPKKKGIPAAFLAVAAGIADESPFIRDTTLLGKFMDPRQREHAIAADIASHLVPGAVQEMAAEQDKKTPYNPFERPQSRVITEPDFSGALKQNLEKEIPGLRKNLPKRNLEYSNR